VGFAVTTAEKEETTFTEQFETGVLRREAGWVRLELISRWEPPLESLVDVSRQFPALRFAVEWEQSGDGRYGCATIADESGEIVHLDDEIRRLRGNQQDGEEAMMELRWEIMRETSRRLFGDDWKDEGGPWGEASSRVRSIAQGIAIESVAGRSDLAEEIR